MPRLLLIDGSSYLYRAFHAIRELSAPDGTPTNAIYGFVNMLRKLRQTTPADYIACVFDAKGKTFRDDIYPEYKAQRPPMPDELRSQVEPIHAAVRAFGVPILCVDGVEADDVIGTLALVACTQGIETILSTGDKDMAQLVNGCVRIENSMTEEVLDEAGVLAKFGVRPDQIVDYLTLVGDTVDNVPACPNAAPRPQPNGWPNIRRWITWWPMPTRSAAWSGKTCAIRWRGCPPAAAWSPSNAMST